MLRRYTIVLTLLALLLGGVYASRTLNWFSFDRSVNPLGLDLSVPDALLSTESLAALPRDILQQPIAKRLFTEELAFYYEAHEDRLGALGAIRRIAYEHNTTWSDALMRRVLDEPAQVALWRDGKGALRHYLISIKRSAFTMLIEEAGKIALKDSQLSRAGELATGFSSVPIFALNLSPRRTFLILASGDRLVMLSDPGMLLRKDKSVDRKAGAVIAKLLGAANDVFGAAPVAERTSTSGPAPRHQFAVNAQTVAFGYQKYFPAFEALSFSLDDRGNLNTALLLDPSRTDATAFASTPVSQSLPTKPALCAMLPISWASAASLAGKVDGSNSVPAARALLDQAQGPLGTCWYADSALHAPVFATSLKNTARVTDAELKPLQDWAIQRPDAASLLHTDQLIVFSPDKAAAERVLAVNARRLASLADDAVPATSTAAATSTGSASAASTTGAGSGTTAASGLSFAYVSPDSLARLIKSETIKSLSSETEPHLRAAAQRHFWPRLDELGKMPAFKLSLGADALQGSRGWRPLIWQNMEAR